MNAKNDPKMLVGEVQMFRIRIAAAESKLKVLREQAREAKRRRKVAKRMAQRARKHFKRCKAGVAELRQALAEAEVKLFQAGGRALARTMAKARTAAKREASAQPALPHKSRVPRRVTSKKPASTAAKVVSDGPADFTALDYTAPTSQILEPVS